MQTRVAHLVKQKEYFYDTEAQAEEHCKDAVSQSKGKLSYKKEKDGSFTIRATSPAKE